eukprot:9154260-Heterocapsa_arctica.AAC.1
MKLLLGGIRGKVGGRTDKIREEYPHKCQGMDRAGNTCGLHDIMFTWTTPAHNAVLTSQALVAVILIVILA